MSDLFVSILFEEYEINTYWNNLSTLGIWVLRKFSNPLLKFLCNTIMIASNDMILVSLHPIFICSSFI